MGATGNAIRSGVGAVKVGVGTSDTTGSSGDMRAAAISLHVSALIKKALVGTQCGTVSGFAVPVT